MPDPEQAIRSLFVEYGAAIEAHSVDAIRRLYPGLSPAQAREVYVFQNPSNHRTQRESIAFQARLRREGDRWRIASLR
jgi:hypothetical protein